jgi:phage terminase large subunit-like protein
MDTPWYKSGWSHRFSLGRQKFTPDGQIKYQNDKMGYHLSTSVSGSNTGEGGDRLVADDPHNMKEIHSENMRAAVVQWWDEVMATRINDQRKVAKVIIMQRGHEADLSGHVLNNKAGYVHLNLQAEFVPKRRCFTHLNDGRPFFADPRTEEGQLLFPERFPREVINRLKVDLGSAYDAQFQQDPTPAEGGILKRSWWRYWAPAGHPLCGTPDENGREILPLPHRFEQRLDSWDMAFKDKDDSDYVVGQAWGRIGALAFLISQARGHFDFIESQTQLRALRLVFPRQLPGAIYIEDRANGTAIIRTLQDEVPGIIGSDVDVSKEARAHAMSPRLKAGNYVIPHPALAGYEWVARTGNVHQEGDHTIPYQPGGTLAIGSFLNEHTMFPNSANDDQVDTTTQADKWLFLQEEFTEENFADTGEY